MSKPKRKYRDLFLGARATPAEGDKSHPIHTILKEEGFRSIPVDLIRPNPDQPRKHFDPDALRDLTASVKDKGVLQPILVRPDGDSRHFILIAGERRWRAATAAGVPEIPALIRHQEDSLEVAIIENLQRENLHPLEEAEALLHLKTIKKFTDEELAQVVGKSRKAVNESLLLNQLPKPIKAEWRTSATATKSQLLQVLRAGSPEKIAATWGALKSGELKTVRDLRSHGRAKRVGRPKHYRFDFTPKDHKFQVTVTFRKSKATPREVRDALKAATKHAR